MSRTSAPAGGRAKPSVEALEERNLLSAEQYVAALYADLLHRPAQPSEISGWVQQMRQGASPQQVATAFTNSNEFRADLVRDDYQRILNRQPSASEVQLWVNQMAGGMTGEQVEAAILGSNEFFASSAGIYRFAGAPGWLEGIYRVVLGRDVDSSGLQTWNNAATHGASRQAIAQAILASNEAHARVVDAVYAELLNRNPDASGAAFWTDNLNRGMTQAQLEAMIASSQEFISLVAQSDTAPSGTSTTPGTNPSSLGGFR
jgi:Domain of unknown function (DUF4214)